MFTVIKKLFTYQRRQKEDFPFAVLFKKFQSILQGNNRILELMADMGDKLGGEYVFDGQYIEDAAEKVSDQVFKLISGLSILTQRKNDELFLVYERIYQAIQEEFSGRHSLPSGNFVLPLSDLSSELIEQVGEKMATLGDVNNRLEMATPDGFVITTQAFFHFMNQNSLLEKAEQIAANWEAMDEDTMEKLVDEMQESILNASVPRNLTAQIFAQVDALARRMNRPKLYLAVRSSAWGEGGEAVFSGQYESILNVSSDQLLDSYRRVVASAYSYKAWSYRLHKGYHENETAIAVGCQVMASSQVSGVLQTYAPHIADGAMAANAMWGLCAPVVGGNYKTDTAILERTPPYSLRSFDVADKRERLVLNPEGGLIWQETPEELYNAPCLTEVQLHDLARTAMRIERYYKRPQEIEWTFDTEGKLLILQTRPIRFSNVHSAPDPLVSEATRDAEIIFSAKGFVVQRGVGIGKVFLVQNDDDLKNFPLGAVMVTRYTSPRYSSIMHKARGIITDIGSPTGHMASLARECRVPTIVDTQVATSLLRNGEEITLDATQNIIYRGTIRALDRFELIEDEVFEDFYEYRLLRRLLKHISPLNLLDSKNQNFTPSACRTFHDITRYIHETAIKELIDQCEKNGAQYLSAPKRLEYNIPLGLMIIDAGKGTNCLPEARVVTPEEIISLPLRDFLCGLDSSGMWCTKPMPVNLGCFMSSLTRTFPSSMASPKQIGRNLAVVMENFMNINLRLGYHFTIIDACISDTIKDNSIYFRFLGGVTEFIRRSRRANFIAQVLEHFDFRIEMHGDLVIGRIKKLSRPRMSERMQILGGLVGYTRQLDAQMHSNKDIARHTQLFIDAIYNVMGGRHDSRN